MAGYKTGDDEAQASLYFTGRFINQLDIATFLTQGSLIPNSKMTLNWEVPIPLGMPF